VQLGQGTLVAGRYVVERKIGEGSWGEVWLAHHAAVGMRVALKSLRATKLDSHDAVVRLGREAKFLGRVQSDYVARALDFIDDDVYGMVLVMEYVDGDSLGDVLERGTISIDRAIAIGKDVAAGLCDLHAARVVHRDLKPANVILRPLATGGERAVIIDFSLGRLVGRSGGEESSLTQLTGAAMSVGTLPYMAPEQVLDSRKVTFASDVYALGAMLYRCVAGRYVFAETEDAAVARRKLTAEAPMLELLSGDPKAEGFVRIVMRALRRRPEDRYADARSMLDELTALDRVERFETPSPSSDAPARPSATLLVFAGAVLLGAGAAAGSIWTRSQHPFVVPAPIASTTASTTASAPPIALAQSVETPPPTPAAVVAAVAVDEPADARAEAAPIASARPVAIDPPRPPPRPSAAPRPAASAPSPYDED
jgi:serine/threonine-protein kinase